MADNFFDEQSEQSQVKAAIVTKYFWAWAKVITGYLKGQKKDTTIQYIDLFAGPGRYECGSKSTPLLILEQAIKDDIFRHNLVTHFNDMDPSNTSTLVQAINALDGVDTLKHKPHVHTEEVGEEIVKMFEELKLVPTLFFVDPWGYKGLSLRLINSVLKDWGCECIFFFNYNRINMGLGNDAVKKHMEALFGEERAFALRQRLEPLGPEQRQLTIVEELCQALKAMGGRHVLPFCFRNSRGNRTSHHLIFVSKHPLGYGIMKEIMANESSLSQQGVASFEYNPADKRQPLLFEYARPVDELEELLLERYAGRQMTVEEVFDEHNVGTPYVKKNYKELLMRMTAAGAVTAERPGKKIRSGTFPDDIRVTFPAKKKAAV